MVDRMRLLILLFALIAGLLLKPGFAVELKDVRVKKTRDASVLVLDLTAKTPMRMSKRREGKVFTIEFKDTRAGVSVSGVSTRGSHIKRIGASRKKNNLVIRIETNTTVVFNKSSLRMPRNQGERILIRMRPKKVSRESRLPERGLYAIELGVQNRAYDGSLLESDLARSYRIYSVPESKGGQRQFRIRMGFFKQKSLAERVKTQVKGDFPWASIIRVSTQERDRFQLARSKKSSRFKRGRERESGEEKSAYEKRMEEGRKAMSEKNYVRARAIYGSLRSNDYTDDNQLAQEYYSVATERSGQRRQALGLYKRYLEAYPGTEGAERMAQRIRAIESLERSPPRLRRASARRRQDARGFSGYAALHQSMRQATRVDDRGESSARLSAFDNQLFAVGQYQGSYFDVEGRASLGYFGDLREEEDSFFPIESYIRINSLYAMARLKSQGHFFQVGRIRSKKGGVIGRYDGGEASVNLGSWFTVNALFGKPVDTSRQPFFENDRTFVSMNADLKIPGGYLVNAFYILQTVAGDIDREAVGGSAQYLGSDFRLYTLIDYDLKFASVNAFINTLSYTTPFNTQFDFNYSMRRSPYLTLRNALLGDPTRVREEFLEAEAAGFDEFDLALGKTYSSNKLEALMTIDLFKKYSLNAGYTYFTLTNDPIADINDNDIFEKVDEKESRISFLLSGSDLFSESFHFTMGYDFSQFDDSNMHNVTVDFKTRLGGLTFRPRLQIWRRDFTDDSDTIKAYFGPALYLDYQVTRSLKLEFELHSHSYIDRIGAADEETLVRSWFLGYRYEL